MRAQIAHQVGLLQSFDIIVVDDSAIAAGGTMLTCVHTIFCDGVDGTIERGSLAGGANANNNTDCNDVGLIGKPGKGVCPE